MQPTGFLWFPLAWMLLAISLITGVLGFFREIQAMYFPTVVERRRAFWTWVRVAFVCAAGVLLLNEHSKVIELSRELPQNQPLQIAPIELQWYPYNKDSGGHWIVRGLVIPNKRVDRAQGELVCNKEFIGVEGGVYPAFPELGAATAAGKNRAHMEIHNWSPSHPLAFALYLESPAGAGDHCDVTLSHAE